MLVCCKPLTLYRALKPWSDGFQVFLWESGSWSYLLFSADFTLESEISFEYVEFVVSMGRPSVHVHKLDMSLDLLGKQSEL